VNIWKFGHTLLQKGRRRANYTR